MNVKMRRSLIVMSLAFTLVFAFAMTAQAAAPSITDTSTISAKVTFAGMKTFDKGTTKAEIVKGLKSVAATKQLRRVHVRVNGKNYDFTALRTAGAFAGSFNYDAMANAAIKGATKVYPSSYLTFTASQKATINSAAASIARQSVKAAKPMRYVYSKKRHRMVIVNSSTGRKTTTTRVAAAIEHGLKLLADSTDGAVTVGAATIDSKAGVRTRARLGKCIVVDKSQGRLFVFNHGKKIRTYKVSVGKRGYATPTGTYRIGTKRYRPTWYNPGSSWGKGMPSSIGPGASNPLGLRAMNLNQNGHDTGLRIHGTVNIKALGSPASHGCVRVANKNIVKLYKIIPKGTLVIVQP